ncbi:histidine phosphatase family protein [Neobacillus mesonae]|uniref:histidine phosphatase family protein n=1 Tax=Neobacillus mesonae TaxID=1193713 RepID=UPI002E229D25|nr:histidine phosphatase family protein [Neobacillus mesonae]
MQITLIRHLPTEWNKKQWLQGKRDIPILEVTPEFQLEIDKNRQVLHQLAPFELVLASSLMRTQQTARQYGFYPETERLLDELDFGVYEGKSKEILLKEHGYVWQENPLSLVLGESINHFEKRIKSFIKKYQPFSNLLVFGHGSWIRGLISYSHDGHINRMNKITVANNECITLYLEEKRKIL